MEKSYKSDDEKTALAVAEAIVSKYCADAEKPEFRQNPPSGLTATTENLRSALKEFSTPKASESVSQLLAMESDNPEIARKASLKEAETVKIRAYIIRLLAMKDGDPAKVKMLDSINYYLKICRITRSKGNISEDDE